MMVYSQLTDHHATTTHETTSPLQKRGAAFRSSGNDTQFIDFVPPKKWLELFKGMQRAYGQELMKQVFDIVRSEVHAQRIVRETFLRFCKEGQALPVESYKSWLFLVAKTHATQLSRRAHNPFL